MALNPNYMNVRQLNKVIGIFDAKIEAAKDDPVSQRKLRSMQNGYIFARNKILNYVRAQQKKGINLTTSQRDTLRLADIRKSNGESLKQVKTEKAYDWADALENRRGFIIGTGATLTAFCMAEALTLNATGGKNGVFGVILEAVKQACIANPAMAGWLIVGSTIAATTTALAVAPAVKRSWQKGNDRKSARLRAADDIEFEAGLEEELQGQNREIDESVVAGEVKLNEYQVEAILNNPQLFEKFKQMAHGVGPYKNVPIGQRQRIIENVLIPVQKKLDERQSAIQNYLDEKAGEKADLEKHALAEQAATIETSIMKKIGAYPAAASRWTTFFADALAAAYKPTNTSALIEEAMKNPAYKSAFEGVDITTPDASIPEGKKLADARALEAELDPTKLTDLEIEIDSTSGTKESFESVMTSSVAYTEDQIKSITASIKTEAGNLETKINIMDIPEKENFLTLLGELKASLLSITDEKLDDVKTAYTKLKKAFQSAHASQQSTTKQAERAYRHTKAQETSGVDKIVEQAEVDSTITVSDAAMSAALTALGLEPDDQEAAKQAETYISVIKEMKSKGLSADEIFNEIEAQKVASTSMDK